MSGCSEKSVNLPDFNAGKKITKPLDDTRISVYNIQELNGEKSKMKKILNLKKTFLYTEFERNIEIEILIEFLIEFDLNMNEKTIFYQLNK